MKIYEKPMAIVNRFDVEDVIAASVILEAAAGADLTDIEAATGATQGVVFEW